MQNTGAEFGLQARGQKVLTWLLCLFLSLLASTLLAQTNVLQNTPFTYGAGTTFSTVAVSGQTFAQATRIVVNSTSANLYDAGMGWDTSVAISQGERLTLTFYVRKVAPNDGNILRGQVVFEESAAPYTKSLLTKFPCNQATWTKVRIPFTAHRNFAVGGGGLRFQFAHGPQTFEIGGVSLVSTGLPPAPPAGSSVLPTSLATYNGSVGSVGTVTMVPVSGQTFTQAYHVATTGNGVNIYDAQIGWATNAAITQNDLLLLTFWMRKISPLDGTPVRGQVVFEDTGSPYTHSLTASYPVDGNGWTLFQIPFTAAVNHASGGGSLRFQFAAGPQVFEVGGISVKKYPTGTNPATLPTSTYYPGRDLNAIWRTDASNRIEQNRKGDLTVTVQTTTGQPVSGANVFAQMTRHAFRVGSAVTAQHLTGTGADNDTYRNYVSSLFTTTVLENDLKWPFWEGWASWNRQATLDALTWLTTNRLPVRGHNLIWPSWGNMPSDTVSLSASQLRSRIDSHFADVLGATNCYQWDVINEPLDNYDVQGRISGVNGVPQSNGVLGNAEMVRWYQNARALEPNTKLYLNDYNILEAGGSDITHQNYTFAVLQYLLNNGAPLDGFGYQSHFSGNVTPISSLFSILDRFAALPLEFSVTEFDVGTLDTALQSDYTRDFLTVIFSRPELNDFMMWGFWEGAHWIPEAAMFQQDWTWKPNALTYTDLFFNQWWTNANGTSNASGQFGTRGFRGTYNVTVQWNGQSQTVAATLGATGNVTVTLANPTVSGMLTLQGIVTTATAQPITFDFRNGSSSLLFSRTVNVAPDGLFTLMDIPPGNYTAHIKGAKYLAKNIAVNTASGDVAGLSATLLVGDINGDNSVSLSDYARFKSAYGSTPTSSNWNASADLNGDGTVSLSDYALFKANYGRAGDP